jgi:hypothetical protein
LSAARLRERMRDPGFTSSAWAAARVTVTVSGVILPVYLAGRMEWVGFATFGGFAALFGRGLRLWQRFRRQCAVGVSLVLSVGLGVLVAESGNALWLTVGVGAVWAALVAFAGEVFDWKPVGPLFQMIAFTACALVPAQEEVALGTAVLVAAAAAAFAVLVGVVGGLAEPGFLQPPAAGAPRRIGLPPGGWVHGLSYVLVVGGAGAASNVMGLPHAYWAMLTAVVPLAAPDIPGRLLRARQRILGTAGGLVLAAAMFSVGLSGLAAVIVIILLQAGSEFLVIRHYGLALVLITPLALLVTHLVAPEPVDVLIRDRAIQTVIGVVIAVVVIAATRRWAYETGPAVRAR